MRAIRKNLSVGLSAGLMVLCVVFMFIPDGLQKLRASGLLSQEAGAGICVALATGDPLTIALSAPASSTTQPPQVQSLPCDNPLRALELVRESTATAALFPAALPVDIAGLSAIASLGETYAHVIAPADSKIVTFRDLCGRKIGVGGKDTPPDLLARAMLEFYRFSSPPVLVQEHSPDIEQAFRNGEIDAVLMLEPLFGESVEKLLASGWHRLVSIPESEALTHFLPGSFSRQFPSYCYGPDRSLPLAETQILTLALNLLLIASADASPSEVESLLLFAHQAARSLRASPAPVLSSAVAAPFAVHSALPSQGETMDTPPPSDVSKRMIPPLGFLAALICLVQAQRRNHKAEAQLVLRRFSERIEEAGQAIAVAETPARLSAAFRQLMATMANAQQKAPDKGGVLPLLYAQSLLHSLNGLHRLMSPQWWENQQSSEEQSYRTPVETHVFPVETHSSSSVPLPQPAPHIHDWDADVELGVPYARKITEPGPFESDKSLGPEPQTNVQDTIRSQNDIKPQKTALPVEPLRTVNVQRVSRPSHPLTEQDESETDDGQMNLL